VIRNAGITAIVNLGSEMAELTAIERESGLSLFSAVEDDLLLMQPNSRQRCNGLTKPCIWTRRCWSIAGSARGVPEPSLPVILSDAVRLKMAEKQLKGARSVPTSYAQWRLLRDYHRAMRS
jgi:hypothetical protein